MTGAWYVGLDPSSSRAGVAAFNDTTGELRHTSIHIKGREFARRYVDMRVAIRCFLAPLADDGVWCAVVERPNTSRSGATLGGAFGVSIEAVASALPNASVHDLGPQQIDPLAGVPRTAGVDRKTRTAAQAFHLGYRGDSQDVADAVCCAAAARALIERDQGKGVA